MNVEQRTKYFAGNVYPRSAMRCYQPLWVTAPGQYKVLWNHWGNLRKHVWLLVSIVLVGGLTPLGVMSSAGTTDGQVYIPCIYGACLWRVNEMHFQAMRTLQCLIKNYDETTWLVCALHCFTFLTVLEVVVLQCSTASRQWTQLCIDIVNCTHHKLWSHYEPVKFLKQYSKYLPQSLSVTL